jgi:hypothetical protein
MSLDNGLNPCTIDNIALFAIFISHLNLMAFSLPPIRYLNSVHSVKLTILFPRIVAYTYI